MEHVQGSSLSQEQESPADELRKFLRLIRQLRNRHKFQQGVALARRNGFVDSLTLTWILANDEQYKTALPRLWEEYQCDSYGSRKLETETVEGRVAAWLKMLDRFTTNELSSALGKSGLPKIQALPLRHGDNSHINLEDLAGYFRRVLDIPLPGLLFPSDEQTTHSLMNPHYDAAQEKDRYQPRKKDFIEKLASKVFPSDPGIKWDDVGITAISDHVVKIRTPRGEERLTYGEMGFADKRNPDKPTKLWTLLLAFCECRGTIQPAGQIDQGLYKAVSDLNRKLQRLFGITESFLSGGRYQRKKGYVSKIRFADQRDPDAMARR